MSRLQLLRSILIGLSVGAAFSIATSALTGPALLLAYFGFLAALLAALSFTIPANLLRLYEQVEPELAERCPRCEAASRTAAGWCASCTAELHASESRLADPAARFFQCAEEHDWRGVRGSMARRVVAIAPNGKPRVIGRRRWLCTSRLLHLLTTSTTRLEATYRDPRDASVSWLRSQATISSRLFGRARTVTSVTRCDHEGDLVTALSLHAALPGAAGVRPAGTMSAPEPA